MLDDMYKIPLFEILQVDVEWSLEIGRHYCVRTSIKGNSLFALGLNRNFETRHSFRDRWPAHLQDSTRHLVTSIAFYQILCLRLRPQNAPPPSVSYLPTQNSPPSALLHPFLPPTPPSPIPILLFIFSLGCHPDLPSNGSWPTFRYESFWSAVFSQIIQIYLPQRNMTKFCTRRRSPNQEFIDNYEILSAAKCIFIANSWTTVWPPPCVR